MLIIYLIVDIVNYTYILLPIIWLLATMDQTLKWVWWKQLLVSWANKDNITHYTFLRSEFMANTWRYSLHASDSLSKNIDLRKQNKILRKNNVSLLNNYKWCSVSHVVPVIWNISTVSEIGVRRDCRKLW